MPTLADTPAMQQWRKSMIEPYKEFEQLVQAKLGHAPNVVDMLTWQAYGW